MNKESRILITGGNGLIGRYITLELLKQGYHNIEIFSRNGFSDDKDLVQSTLLDSRGSVVEFYPLSDRIELADVVIHCAAVVSLSPGKFQDMKQINVNGTSNVLNLCLMHKVKKVIYLSSVAAIGRNEKSDDISEETKWEESKFNTYYGITKYLSEQEAWRAYHEGLNITMINPCIVFGDGNWERSSLQIFEKVYKGLPYYPAGSTAIVDAVDVAKIVHAALINEDISGERYIAAGTNISYKELFEKMSKALSVKAPKKLAPKIILSALWRIEYLRNKLTGSDPIITKESVISTGHKSVYDNSKSLTLNWGKYTDIDTTINKYCAAFLQSKSK